MQFNLMGINFSDLKSTVATLLTRQPEPNQSQEIPTDSFQMQQSVQADKPEANQADWEQVIGTGNSIKQFTDEILQGNAILEDGAFVLDAQSQQPLVYDGKLATYNSVKDDSSLGQGHYLTLATVNQDATDSSNKPLLTPVTQVDITNTAVEARFNKAKQKLNSSDFDPSQFTLKQGDNMLYTADPQLANIEGVKVFVDADEGSLVLMLEENNKISKRIDLDATKLKDNQYIQKRLEHQGALDKFDSIQAENIVFGDNGSTSFVESRPFEVNYEQPQNLEARRVFEQALQPYSP